jgi:hypothetical protein
MEINLTTLGERLEHAMRVRKYSDRTLAFEINERLSAQGSKERVAWQTIQGLRRRKSTHTKHAGAIAQALEINLDWLISGEGEMERASSPERLDANEPVAAKTEDSSGMSDEWLQAALSEVTLGDVRIAASVSKLDASGKKLLEMALKWQLEHLETQSRLITAEQRVAKLERQVKFFKRYHRIYDRLLGGLNETEIFTFYALIELMRTQLPRLRGQARSPGDLRRKLLDVLADEARAMAPMIEQVPLPDEFMTDVSKRLEPEDHN